MKLTRMTRTAGWLAVAGLLSAALIAPASAFAQGSSPATECEGYTLYFKIDDAPSDGVYENGDAGVETNWSGQVITVSNAADGNQQFDWAATQVVLKVTVKYGNQHFHGSIAPDGLSGTVDNNNQNAISHVTWCGSPVTTTTTTDTTSTETTDTTSTDTTETTDTETTSTTETTDTTSTVTTETTDTETTDTETTDTETTDTVTTTTDTSSTTTSQTTETTQTTETVVTPEGSVEAETGTPDVTPPSTDTGSISGPSSPSGSAWQLLLVAMAGLLATVLLLTPAPEARKR